MLLAQFLGQGADGAAQAIFAFILVLEPLSRGTPGRILALFVLTLLPYSLISPFLGVFVDRWSRRALLVWTNLIRAGVLLLVPLLLHGTAPLYLSVLLLLGLGRLSLTTKGALLPVVLNEEGLLGGNSLSGGGGMIAALLGGAAGIVLLKVVTPRQALTLAGVIYGLAAISAARLSSTYAHLAGHHRGLAAASKDVLAGLLSGLRAIARRPRARLPLASIFILRTIAMVAAIAAILIIKQRSLGTSGRLNSAALALGAAGVGAFAAAVAAPFSQARLKPPGLIVAGFLVSGAGMAALGGIESLPALLGLTFVVGFGAFLSKVAVDAEVQAALPDDLRGRAFALYDILYNLASVVAGALMVGLQGFPFRAVLVSFGIVTLGGAVVMGAGMRRAGMALS